MHEVRLQGICTISLNCLSTLQWQIQGRARGPPPPSPPPLFLDQTEAQRAEKIWGRPVPPPLLSKGLDDRPHLISRSGSGTTLVHLEGNSILDILWSLVRAWTMWFTSIFLLRHVVLAAIYLDFTKPWSCKNGRKNEKIDMYDFPAHDCTQELNSSPYFSSIDRQCKGPSLSRKIVEIQKFCSYW